jgi:3-hydroxyacyl-CoA dehydrogenase
VLEARRKRRGAALLGGDAEEVLVDAADGAAAKARDTVADTLGKLADKGRLNREALTATVGRMRPVDTLADLAGCDLIIEAVVEDLAVKKRLFADLEAIVATDALLVSNTSSLSVTAIAAACRLPGRVAGYHFFNPVPLMKVVEVIRGVRTDEATVEALLALTRRSGHAPVIAQELVPFFTIAIVAAPSTTPLIEFISDASAVPSSVRVFAPNVNPVTTPKPTPPEPFAFNVNPPAGPPCGESAYFSGAAALLVAFGASIVVIASCPRLR